MLQRLPFTRAPQRFFPIWTTKFWWTSVKCFHDNSRVHFVPVSQPCSRWRVIMWRKRGLSLNHIAETLFASETFVKKAAFRLNENKTRTVSEPPKRKSKKRKISGSWKSLPLKWFAFVKIDFLSPCYGCRLFLAAEMIRLARTTWLYTVCNFAASKHCPWARRTKRSFQRF